MLISSSQPNGANLTGGGTGGSAGAGKATATPYTPFNGSGAAPSVGLPLGLWPAMLVGWAGLLVGGLGVASRF